MEHRTKSSRICRICCSQQPNDLVSLLDAQNKPIVKKLRACADITIERDDLLPKYICTTCLPKLTVAYNFKIQCEFMDQKLRESIAKTVQKQKSLPFTVQSDTSTLTDCSCFAEMDSNFDYGSDQLTTDDVEPIFEEECIGEEHIVDDELYQVGDGIQSQPNDEIVATVTESDNGYNGMDISPEVAEIEKFDSLGSLPSAKEPEETSDQDMFSVKSDSVYTRNIKEPYTCETCSETFYIHSEYTRHTKSHGKNRFQCPTCNKWFAKRYLVNAHQKTHTGAKNYECSLCQKRFTTQTNLDRHIRVIHQQQRNHKCTTCQKAFSQLSSLRLHQSVHVAERDFACDICNNKFKTEVHLKLHKKRHMPTEYRRPRKKYTTPKIYKPKPKLCVCNECGKRFKSVALLKSHMQSHSMEKKYECDHCKKRFSFQQTLRNHLFLHTGEKRFKCDVCNVSFRQIGHLQGHKLTHTRVKPHTCSVCDKAFALRGNLTVHMRTHNGAQPHQCSVCPKKFSDSNGLKRHQLMHQRETETNPTIEQILEAPIIEAPITETPISESIFDNVSAFNPDGLQFIQSPVNVVDSQVIYKIE